MNSDFRGPCASDPELWFSFDAEEITYAKNVCSSCPMRTACLQAALDCESKDGVWGGTTPQERRRMVREASQAARARAKEAS